MPAAGRLLRSPWAPGGVVLALCAVWVLCLLSARGAHDPLIPTAGPALTGDPRDFAYVGRYFLDHGGQSSPAIAEHAAYGGDDYIGYDGEFFYFMALDPLGARPYIDSPAYRYPRIGYPMLARILALGRPSLVPWTLILVNALALAAGTVALAAWLRRRDVSAWWSLAFGLYPGLLIAFRFDLSEVLAYSLVAIAFLVLDRPGRWAGVGAGALLGAAVLTREATAVFPAVLALAALRSSPARALLLAGLGIGPYLAWRVLLFAWLHNATTSIGDQFDPVPLHGFGVYAGAATHGGLPAGQAEGLSAVLVPCTIAALLAAAALRRRGSFLAGWLVLANYVPFVLFLSLNAWVDYRSSARVTSGVLLSATLAIPEMIEAGSALRAWSLAASALWLSTLPQNTLLPILVTVARGLHLHR